MFKKSKKRIMIIMIVFMIGITGCNNNSADIQDERTEVSDENIAEAGTENLILEDAVEIVEQEEATESSGNVIEEVTSEEVSSEEIAEEDSTEEKIAEEDTEEESQEKIENEKSSEDNQNNSDTSKEEQVTDTSEDKESSDKENESQNESENDTSSDNTSEIERVCVGWDENGEPILITIEEWEYLNSEEYILANGESAARTSYTASAEYIVLDYCPEDGYEWTTVEFWWEPTAWDTIPSYFEWEVYCNNLWFEDAKGNALAYMPSYPSFEESYRLYTGDEFKFTLSEVGKYGVTTLYVRKIE